MLSLRNELRSTSKIVASAVVQSGVDIDAVEKYWVEGIGIDYLIKRKFLTWGVNTTLDASRSSDPAAYLNTDEVPCPFIFERLNIDSRGNVMVCGYDISANTSMGNVNTATIRDIWHGEGFRFLSRQAPGRARQGHRYVRRLPRLEVPLLAAQLLEGRRRTPRRARERSSGVSASTTTSGASWMAAPASSAMLAT